MGRPVLEVRDLCVGAAPAVCRDVSFTVTAGEAVAVLGGPGAGKSQLLRCIGLEVAPASGSVYLNRVELTQTAAERRHRVRGRAIELVHPPVSRETATDTDTTSTRPGLPSARPTPTVPVAGMRQRIQIARAVTQGASALLVDEPFVGVDHRVRSRIEELVGRARAEAGTAVVVATRHPAVARCLSDRVVILHEGEVIESGPTDGVLDAPHDPRTRSLLTRRSA
jgi:ABC-type glutathione transport system ATPase component